MRIIETIKKWLSHTPDQEQHDPEPQDSEPILPPQPVDNRQIPPISLSSSVENAILSEFQPERMLGDIKAMEDLSKEFAAERKRLIAELRAIGPRTTPTDVKQQ